MLLSFITNIIFSSAQGEALKIKINKNECIGGDCLSLWILQLQAKLRDCAGLLHLMSCHWL